MGYTADVRRPVLGDPLPAHLDDHAGVVVFGGPMSANDADEGIRRETRFMDVDAEIRQALSRHLPGRADPGQSPRRPGGQT
jgi:GMP synthase-like glutamine amidotransferase